MMMNGQTTGTRSDDFVYEMNQPVKGATGAMGRKARFGVPVSSKQDVVVK